MNIIDTLNHWGARFAGFALPMLLQSSLVIVALFVIDLALRKKARAVVRYGLWLLALVKLVLPPSFAAPTAVAYWLPEKKAAQAQPVTAPRVVVRYAGVPSNEATVLPSTTSTRPKLLFAGWLLLAWATVALGFTAWLLRRSRYVARSSRQATPAPVSPEKLLDACRQQLAIRRPVRLRLSANAGSPAVCGLWRPVILIPHELAHKLSALQLRAVLLHELAHVKRGDVLVHYVQTLLQIFYWWHPLLWLANARIRRVREQAVDEMVTVQMGDEAEAYPATLLEVARLAFQGPMLALGLVGIVESKSALAHRIKRLLEGPVPKSAKLGILRLAIVAVVGALLLPMARGERRPANRATRFVSRPSANPVAIETEVKFILVPDTVLEDLMVAGHYTIGPNGHIAWMLPAEQRIELLRLLEQQPGVAVLSSQQVTTATAQETQVETAGIQPFQHRKANATATCRITPYVSGSLIDLSISAAITESGDFDSAFAGEPKPDQEPDDNGSGQVFAMNAVPDINYDVGTAHSLVGDGGVVILQNPVLKDADGKRILVVVSPRIVWQSASVVEPNSNAISVAAWSSALRQSRVENDVTPSPTTKPTQAQPAGAAPKDNGSETAKEPLTVTIARTEPFLYLGSKPISLQDLEAELKRAASLNAAVMLSLRADKDALFGEIVKVADAAKKAGIKSVTLITEPRATHRDSVRATNTNGPVESHPGNAAPTKLSPASPTSTVRPNHEPQPDTTTLQDAKVLIERGQLDAAEQKLRAILKADPDNQAAQYYLEQARVESNRRRVQPRLWHPTIPPRPAESLASRPGNVVKESETNSASDHPFFPVRPRPDKVPVLGDLPLLGRFFRSKSGPVRTSREAIEAKLNQILLPELQFDNTPLPAVLKFLGEESARRDPDKEGINFLINPTVMASAAQAIIDPTTGQPVTLPPTEPLDMNNVIVRINPPLKNVRLADVLEAIIRVADKPIRYSIEEYAVIFSQKPSETSQLKTRIFKVDPETVIQRMHRALRDSGESEIEIFGNSNDETLHVFRKFFGSIGINVLPPNMMFYKDRTGMLMVRATAEELDRVQEAIDALNSVRGEKSGADSGVHSTGSREAAVLDAGEKRSTVPVGALETRIYKLDLYVLRRNLQKLSGGASVGDTNASLPDVVRNFLQEYGVVFQSPKTMFLNEQTGALLVRATADELKIVHRAVVVLNTGQDAEDFGIFSPVNEATDSEPTKADSKTELITRLFRLNPQTLIQNLRDIVHGGTADEKTDAVQQLVRDFLAAAGVSVRAPNMVFFNPGTGALMIRAPAGELDFAQKAIEVLNVAPPQITLETKFMEMPTDAARKLGLDLPSPGATSNTWTRVLTAEQMQTVLRAARQVAGADILTAPKVTTLSGRQTQIQSVEIRTIVNGIQAQALAAPGVQRANGVPAQPYVTGQIPVGPTLDLVPYVAADGYTIHLSAIPQVTEFLRYDTTIERTTKRRVWVDGEEREAVVPLPIFRTRKMATSADVYDGQTLVLGNPMVTMVSQLHDGQSTTNTIPEVAGKRLLVFITSTIIDPAGNPIHTKDNLPNDPNSIPPPPRASP